MKLLPIVTTMIIFSFAGADEANYKFSLDLRGWSGNRTLVDKWALNSLLNSSPGEFSHLRGGEINEEKSGPEILVSTNYFLHPDLALSVGAGYMSGKTTASFVENSLPYSMYWKSGYFYIPVNLEYKLPIISAERLWFKVFAGGTWHVLTAEIKSDNYQEDILRTDASGSTLGYQYGFVAEYALSRRLSLFYTSVTWKGADIALKKNGSFLTRAQFRINSPDNLEISLDGTSQFVGLRVYF